MSDDPSVRDADLYRLTVRTLREAAPLIKQVTEDRGWHSTYYRFPEFAEPFKSGFPHIVFSHHEVPHYTNVIGVQRGRFEPLGYDDIPTFNDLFEYVQSNEALSEQLGVYIDESVEHSLTLSRITVAAAVFGLLEHVLHLHGFDFRDDELGRYYEELEAGLLEDRLLFDIVVPIALTPFDFSGNVKLSDHLAIEAMTDEWQLARMPESRVGIGEAAASTVISAATHAFVFRSYAVQNTPRWVRRFDQLSFYPVDRVERAFSALRIVTGRRIGYTQMLIRPRGWATRWKGWLPPIGGSAIVRRYPPAFDDWGWTRDPGRSVTSDQAHSIGEVDAALDAAPDHVQLASRRLFGAALREVEEDEIIDICIGLEALLTDGTTTEVTHKLSLRAAAVLAAEGEDAVTVFGDMRAIYAYRSAIVHGKGAEKKRFIRRNGENIEAVSVASDYLRRILWALLTNPDWRDAKIVDRELLLRRLSQLDSATLDEQV